VVQHEHVDVIALQPGQRGVARAPDVACRQTAVVRPRPHVAVELRGQYGALAASVALRSQRPMISSVRPLPCDQAIVRFASAP